MKMQKRALALFSMGLALAATMIRAQESPSATAGIAATRQAPPPALLEIPRVKKVVTELYQALPEMRAIYDPVYEVERDDPAFLWLEGQVQSLLKSGIPVRFEVSQRPHEQHFSSCAPRKAGDSIITVYRQRLWEQTFRGTTDRFELCWFFVLHELHNARQREKFLALYNAVRHHDIERKDFVRQAIGFEMTSMNMAARQFEEVFRTHFWRLKMPFNFINTAYGRPLALGRTSLIQFYEAYDLGPHYSQAYDHLWKQGAPSDPEDSASEGAGK